jgi:RNAse (barnase) inhibitor barstar
MIINELAPLLQQPLQGGVVDLGVPAELSEVADELTASGWTARTLTDFADRDGFYAEIAAQLEFPAYFGANLDALWDSLRSVKIPTAVIISWSPFADADPDRAAKILRVLQQRARSAPPFAVVLA